MDNKTTEETRFPLRQIFLGGNQNDTTRSPPSERSQADRENFERNNQPFFSKEESQKLPISLTRTKLQTRENQQGLAQTDDFLSPIETMKIRIFKALLDSYDGKLKAAYEDFDENLKGKFLELFPQFGDDTADLSLRVGLIYYRAHTDVEALEWLYKALDFSKRFEEEDKPAHFRKLYLCLADVLMKREKWSDAEIYLEKGDEIIKNYFENDESYEGIRTLSWVHALRAHLESRKGNFEEAEKFYKSQLELKKETLNERLIALGLDYLADFYITHEKIELAEPVVERALKISENIKDKYYTEARHLRNKGRILFEKGNLVESQELYHKAFRILAEKLPDGNSLEEQYREEYMKMFEVEFESTENYSLPPSDSV